MTARLASLTSPEGLEGGELRSGRALAAFRPWATVLT